MIVNFFFYLFCERKEKIVYKLFYYVNKSIKSLELLKMLFNLNEISKKKIIILEIMQHAIIIYLLIIVFQ